MQRLTIKGLFCDIAQCSQFNCDGATDKTQDCDSKKVYEKLREYEDLEEQGRLHIAPIVDGTEIYVPFSGLSDVDLEDGILVSTYLYGLTEFENGIMNKDWFLTMEEAKKALEDSKNA